MATLLDLKGAQELQVKSQLVHDFDINYDFKTESLELVPRLPQKKVSTYLISRELAEAVNAAIVTGRPLLIKGEPGSGKTKLAQAVAAYFYGDQAYRYYFEWHVKSKSKARDGGYTFDHVARLRDATITSDEVARAKASDPSNYVALGPMGHAFKAGDAHHKSILLIDEIDKGDIDFPNDLLLELDEMRFKINEMQDTYIYAPTGGRPLVFITSNDERELPPAFLRRCLYYNIPRFTKELLVTIAAGKMKEFYEDLNINKPSEISQQSLEAFVDEFIKLKNAAATKPPSTSELLDWLKLLTFYQYRNGEAFDKLMANKDFQQLALKLNA